MARKTRRQAVRRAGLALAGFAAVALGTAGFSCLARREGPDLSIPRGVGPSGVTMRVAVGTLAPRRTIEVRGPYAIYATDEPGARPAFEGEALPPTELAAEGDALVLASYLFRPGVLRIESKRDGALVVDGVGYRGDIVCRVRAPADGGAPVPLVVNRVGLETYLAGVLGAEMPLSYPDAALRAQAVAARTYALYQARTRAAGAAHDVTDDTSSQVYRGLAAETERSRAIVEETRGVILTWGGLIFPTYFSSTCGGATVPASFSLGDRDIPPLAGGPCGFCDDAKYARWEVEFAKAELAGRLRAEGLAVEAVSRVEVTETGPARHAALVRVVHPRGELRVRAPRFRRIVGPGTLRSTLFTVEDRGDKLIFRGRGWGHGVGLCQNGARGMARAGYGTTEILRRYYPGAEAVRID